MEFVQQQAKEELTNDTTPPVASTVENTTEATVAEGQDTTPAMTPNNATVPAPEPTPVPVAPTPAPVAAPVAPAGPAAADPNKVAESIENLTIYGNKSLQELHEIQSRRSHLSAGILFTDPSLRIPKPILESLTLEMRFERPSEIQASTLPIILGRNNLIAQAQSGAGKTIAFTIGMLAGLVPGLQTPQALCLTPTRELALQILRDAVRPLSSRLAHVTFEDALPGREIPEGSRCTSQVVVGTPGTVKRWLQRGYLSLGQISVFVLDEADKMVEDRGLGAETLAIRTKLPPAAQILMFSATYSEEIIKYAKKINPRAYLVTPRNKEELVLDVIFQVRMDVTRLAGPGGKLQVLKDIYDFLAVQQSIVFVERKEEAESIARMMRSAGFEVSTLHGDLLPGDRDRVMEDFRAGRTKVLITTNALARGVDVPAVAVVVNYDLPVTKEGSRLVGDPATYLHRIGRCGRFGRRGTAITFLQSGQDQAMLQDIERYFVTDREGADRAGRITVDWDPNDLAGLTDCIEARPKGGEIQPQAIEGNSQAGQQTVKISLFTA